MNLVLNPERYTGYKGDSARRIWQAIYEESCFQGRGHGDSTEQTARSAVTLTPIIEKTVQKLTELLSVVASLRAIRIWKHSLAMQAKDW